MKIFFKTIIGIYFFAFPVFSQISLQSEDITNGKYRLVYANSGYLYSIVEQNGKRILSFSGYGEELSFPTHDLFIALPQGSRPAITVSITKQRLASFNGAELPPLAKSVYELKGYLWVDNYYCAHLVVHPFVLSNNQLIEVLEFRIEMSVNTSTKLTSQRTMPAQKTIIDNPIFGQQWRAQASYAIQQTDSWIDYTQDYVKLGVVKDGIYRIRYNDLLSYGISPTTISSFDPALLKIFLKGKQIPIYVHREAPNTFGANDYIEFLGRRNYGDTRYRFVAPNTAPYTSYYNKYSPNDSSYYEYLDRYSDTTIYWLNWGSSNGARVDTVLQTVGSPADTIRYYDQLLHSEKNVYWDFQLNPGGYSAEVRVNLPELLENETWNDGTLSVGKASATFSVANLFPNKPARAFIKCQDFSSNLATNAHDLAISINSTAAKYDSGFIDKYQVKVLKADFLSSILKTGNNTVDLNSFTVAGNTINSVIRDWFELEYPGYLKTTTDSLSFAYNNLSSNSLSLIAISGLSSGKVSLYKFKLTDSSIVKITNYSRSADTLRFTDTVANGNYYFLLREDKIPAPIYFYKKKFANLRSVSNKADYIAITHPYFQSVAENYVSFIANTYDVTTKLVNIFDVCDEYNYGFWAPEPIKEFLKSTHANWQSPKPKYVLLLGKGTYDYYGNKFKYAGVPRVPNFVPPYGDPVSDTWFVQWDSTGSLIPQMNIGRIPAKSIDEFQSYFSKHQKYVLKGFDEWNKRFLFFSGGNFTDTNQIKDAKNVNDFIITNYVLPKPVGGNVANFYKTANPITNFGPYTPEYVTSEIDQGGVFISYIGHSGTQTWDNSITDISQLANIRDRSPMISDFGCSTGKFAEPDILSFSEIAVNGLNGQAISYIGNSSLGFTSTAYTFPQFFYKKLLVDTSASLGDIHRLAKIDYIKQKGVLGSFGLFIKTNSLIGDPIVKLTIPSVPNISVTNSSVEIIPERPTDHTDTVHVALKYYNLGTAVNDSVQLLITDDYQGNIFFTKTMKRKFPLYIDSLNFTFPVMGKPGEHLITIQADPANTVSEIYENDNTLTFKILVASTSIRSLTTSLVANQTGGKLTFLNPSVSSQQSKFFVDISLNELFVPKLSYQVPYDTFFTNFSIDSSYKGKRVWVRSKYDDANLEGLTYSYIFGDVKNYFIHDSASFSKVSMNGLKIQNANIVLDTNKIALSAISGGFNDGNTAVISQNGQNFVPENTVRGFHVCIFDANTYEFKWYYRFDVQAGSTVSTNFKNLLDTLSANYWVVIAISNDVASNGTLLPASLKTSIKNYGSYYIDSVKVADSWAIIGKKGALAGTVPEKYLKRYSGYTAKIDTSFFIPINKGGFTTQSFGPVERWKNLILKYTSVAPQDIIIQVNGIKKDDSSDSLKAIAASDSIIDLSDIDAKKYSQIKISGVITRNINTQSPSISSLAINYDALPELGTNYQAVSAFLVDKDKRGKRIFSGDTVLQGEKIEFVFRVYNAGGVSIKNVSVKTDVLWGNNSVEHIINTTIDSVNGESYKELSTIYNTSLGFGKRNFYVMIDPDSTVNELYKDNNYFSFPIVVAKNQSQPLLPNLVILQNDIIALTSPIIENTDTARFKIRFENTGALIGDSITISVKEFFQNSNVASWIFRRKYPVSADTLDLRVPILKRAGEHQLQIELDPVGLVLESSETDNTLNYYFSVVTTDFKIIQPTAFTSSSFSRIIWLNPSNIESSVKYFADVEIDTTINYSTSTKTTIEMKEFVTSYGIGSLPRGKRYYWRIRIHNSNRDWTSGTFYLGDSLAYSFGQSDSTSWFANDFEHTSFINGTGAQIIDTKYFLKAISAGFSDGNNGSVELNGINLLSPIFGAGHNLVVLDTTTYSVINLRRFDISANPDESDSLVQFITSVPNGKIVVDVVIGDGANNLTQAARNALRTIGSSEIDKLAFRDSWLIIGRKGAPQGTVPESYKPQLTGSAVAETLIVKKEYSGSVSTSEFGPVSGLSNFTMNSSAPAGTSLIVKLIGKNGNTIDTVILSSQQNRAATKKIFEFNFTSAKIKFDLGTTNQATPVIKSWTIAAIPPTELGLSAKSTILDRNQVIEGEPITVSSTIYNVSDVAAESVIVQLKANDRALERILKTQTFTSILPNDSVTFSYVYDSRNNRGSYAFTVDIDPLDSLLEQTKANNKITVPYTVIGDTLRPDVQVTIDGIKIVNGDYISSNPEIIILYKDGNPSVLTMADTSIFSIRLNNDRVPFAAGISELQLTGSPGEARVRWTPVLPDGENILQISANDVSGNSSDTTELFVNVSSKLELRDVYNIPNPFAGSTHFTFNLTGSAIPDFVSIKIYTVAGRLIQDISSPAKVGFNKIFWDGRDKDGDEIGNGVYLYKIIVHQGEKQTSIISKLVKMR